MDKSDELIIHFIAKFYAASLAFNILISFILWRLYRNKNYLTQCLASLGFGVTFLLQGSLVQDTSYFIKIVVGCMNFPSMLMYSRLMSHLCGHDEKFKKYFVFQALGLLFSYGLYKWDVDVNLMGIPAVLGLIYPLVHSVLKSWIIYRHRLSVISWCLTLNLLFVAFHWLYYVYCLDKPETLVFGFTLAVVLVVGLGNFTTAAVMELLTKEQTEARMEAQYARNMTNSAKLVALGEMASGVAHEINNPLAIIKMATSIFRRNLAKDKIDKALLVEEMTLIDTTVERIAKIISSLRAFSRDASKDQIQAESVQTIISETLNLCKQKLENNEIKLELGEIPPELMAQCRRIEVIQILINLIQNARDAVYRSPERWIRIETKKLDDKVSIEVIDSGPGVPEEIKDKIFQPFFTSKDIGEGIGLGLSVSHGLATSNNGSLFLDRTSAHTKFVLTLPAG